MGIELGFKFWSMTWVERQKEMKTQRHRRRHRNQAVRLNATRNWRYVELRAAEKGEQGLELYLTQRTKMWAG